MVMVTVGGWGFKSSILANPFRPSPPIKPKSTPGVSANSPFSSPVGIHPFKIASEMTLVQERRFQSAIKEDIT